MGGNGRSRAVDELHGATALYTTESVVERLLDRAEWPSRGRRLLDPAAGDGAFLLGALRRLDPAAGDVAATDRVRGWEIHPGAAASARARIAEFLVGRGWSRSAAGRAVGRMIEEGDFLTSAVGGPFDVIAGNPPYLRFSRLPDPFKEIYAAAVPAHARGDLQHAFLDRCCSLVSETGVIAFVTADRWLMNETAAALRDGIGRRLGIHFVGRLDPATSFHRPKDRRQGSPPRVHPVEVILRTDGETKLSRAPVSPDGVALEAEGRPTLGEIASVRIAPWLGSPGVFVVDAATAAALRDADLVPAVDTDDIEPGADTLNAPRRFAIRTEPGTRPVGPVRKHLEAAVKRLPPRAKRTKAWWLPPERITLPLDQPFLLVPRIARRLRAIEVPPGILPINHNLSVVATRPGTSLDEIRALLTSEEAQDWIQRHAPRLEDGFYSISTTLLRRLPLPEAAAA